MRVQLKVNSGLRQFLYLIRIHHLQNPLVDDSLIIQAEQVRQPLRDLVLLDACKILTLGPGHNLFGCALTILSRVQVDRVLNAQLSQIECALIPRLPKHVGTDEAEHWAVEIAVIAGEIDGNGKSKFAKPRKGLRVKIVRAIVERKGSTRRMQRLAIEALQRHPQRQDVEVFGFENFNPVLQQLRTDIEKGTPLVLIY